MSQQLDSVLATLVAKENEAIAAVSSARAAWLASPEGANRQFDSSPFRALYEAVKESHDARRKRTAYLVQTYGLGGTP